MYETFPWGSAIQICRSTIMEKRRPTTVTRYMAEIPGRYGRDSPLITVSLIAGTRIYGTLIFRDRRSLPRFSKTVPHHPSVTTIISRRGWVLPGTLLETARL